MTKSSRGAGWLALVFALAGVAGPARAAELAANSKEIQLRFNLSQRDNGAGFDDTVWQIDARIGWVLGTGRHEPGVVIIYSDQDSIAAANGITEGGFGGLFYYYNLATESPSIIPFFGAAVLWPFSAFSDTLDLVWELDAGARVMAGKKAALNLSLFYRQGSSATANDDPTDFGLQAGVSIFFGGD